MIALEQARRTLDTLDLAQAAAVLERSLEAAKETTYAEFLADLLEAELTVRRSDP
ncbi:MAG: hypothetical protein QJR00_08130 [Bacillota bacterium]|nr:hypothetical protein [Bacillota bacterium]